MDILSYKTQIIRTRTKKLKESNTKEPSNKTMFLDYQTWKCRIMRPVILVALVAWRNPKIEDIHRGQLNHYNNWRKDNKEHNWLHLRRNLNRKLKQHNSNTLQSNSQRNHLIKSLRITKYHAPNLSPPLQIVESGILMEIKWSKWTYIYIYSI